jgi:hypothetical protein
VRASDESTAEVSASDGGPKGGKQLQVHREPTNAAEPDGCDPVTLADDGRPQASGGAASVITIPEAVTAAETAPAATPCPAGAVTLSDASTFILSLVAAHEGMAPEDILAQLIAAAADAIGIHSLIMRDAGEVDLADLPDFALRAANRFRGGGP